MATLTPVDLLSLVPQAAGNVVHVGCGDGRQGEALKARRPVRVIGIEPDPKAAAAARGRLDAVIEDDSGRGTDPLPPGVFDAVAVSADALARTNDLWHLFRQARRWLRPDGVLIAGPFCVLGTLPVRYWDPWEAETLVYRAGFEVPDLTAVVVTDPSVGQGPPPGWAAVARPASLPDFGLTSIVVPAHNGLPLTRRCVDAVLGFTDEPFELVLVDDGSSDGTAGYASALATDDPRVRVVVNPANLGFPAAVNRGVAAAAGRQVVLLNNDVVVTAGWLRRLLRALHSGPSVGLVGPCSNRVSGPQQVPVGYADDLAGLGEFAWEWGKRYDGRFEGVDRLVGFCLLVRRAVFDRVGSLDEGFGLGNFEDDDFCLRARRVGFQATIARDAFVHHDGGRTFAAMGVDYTALLRTNQDRFQRKWGLPAPGNNDGPSDGRPIGPGTVGLSGCLIVRDNAGTIRACLESLRPWVDDLVVVDTGSADDTPRIAAGVGARVHHDPWRDDFSAARNESIRHARGRWVFWMDSDDTIDPANGAALRALALGPHRDDILAYVVRVRCPGPPGSGGDVTVVDHVKLFRNRPDLRFEGRIHEQILPAVRRAGGEVAWTDLFVTHSGYDHTPAARARKTDRDLRLLRLELADRPGHTFTLFNLGMTYADAGDHAAAVGHLEAAVRAAGPGDSHLRKAYALLAHSLARLGRPADALTVCGRGLAAFPGDVELEFRAGVLHHEAGRPGAAAEAYRRALSHRGPRYFASLDGGVGGYKARHNLAAALADLGRLGEAEAEWRRVTTEAPGFRPGWRGLGDILLRAGRPGEAADLAARLSDRPGLEPEGLLLAGRAAEARGDAAAARALWHRAAAADPADPEPARELARSYFGAGPDAAAEAALRDLVRRDPADPAARHNLAAVLLRSGRAAEAAAEAGRSLTLRPGHPGTLRLHALATGSDGRDANRGGIPHPRKATGPMSSYHTREAFEARMRYRQAFRKPVDPVAVFYHASLMPGWEPIAAEQFALLAACGLRSIHCFVIARPGPDAGRFVGIATHYGVTVEILGTADDFGLYEGPTLQALHEWAIHNPEGAVIYLHTKGASRPNDAHKRQWRRVMQRYVVADWQHNLELLRTADVVGCGWQPDPDYPHFCGNFWAARSDWLANLSPPAEYRLSRPDFPWAGAHSWRDRMYVETWLGSEGWHHVEDRVGVGSALWSDAVFGVDASVRGFDYHASRYVGPRAAYGEHPFRWWVVDGWCEPCDPAAIPPAGDPVWEAVYQNDVERGKRTTRRVDGVPGMAPLFDRLRAPAVVAGWAGHLGYSVEDDRTMHGGGVHVTAPGGWLNPHLDYDLHPRAPGRRRALNLVAFLNPEWRQEWGGALLLCDPTGAVVRRILPAPGRLVAFEVGDLSYHGVEPVAADCPVERVTAAVYYLGAAGPHNTRRRALFIPNRGG